VVDIRLGIERLRAWLHNYEAHHQDGHRERAAAARRRRDRLRAIAADPGIDDAGRFARSLAYLRRIDPLVFEELVLAAFRDAGWTVRVNAAYSGDGGIDGRVWVDDWRTVDPWFAQHAPDRELRGWAGVQCKRYEGAVQREHLRQFPHDLARADLVAGFFVHTGTTPRRRTPPTVAEWRERLALPPVRLLSGKCLVQLLVTGTLPMASSAGQPQRVG